MCRNLEYNQTSEILDKITRFDLLKDFSDYISRESKLDIMGLDFLLREDNHTALVIDFNELPGY